MTKEQFETVVTQYENLVYTICYRLTNNPHTAQDLAQEAFISAYTHLDSCNEATMKPWLCRIATNKAKDYLKSAYNRKTDLKNDDEDVYTALYKVPAAEDITMSNIVVSQIESFIYDLKEPYLKVSTLYFIKQHSVDEISKELDRPPKTVHTQIYRAKCILQKNLIREGISDGKI